MPTKNFDAIFRNCRSHLQSLILQMSQLNLKTIIVSGVHPCWHILDIYFPLDNNFDKKIDNICKTTEINGNQINFVFFRQFMGRKDVSHSYRNKASELLDNVLEKL
ncbi:hypothetical protein [Plebeiibacterium marinum]|uniref:Uncharacterized protein n=1 Tax=Plebeiibacterium marinum TaxID=2992111 RepID=A0AAE3MES4_9BACT|nr:hypothetical protein [Plebeiobacterium marinum]MCW3805727.1 hypothetical protein [Plebeiobacterium marinum]